MQTIGSATSNKLSDSRAAIARAESNHAANLHALAVTQSRLDAASLPLPDALTWIFGRDGSLTAMLEEDRWWASCSLPHRAAQFMLRKMDVGGAVACFLCPVHAAQLRVALDNLEAQQAIVAIVPDEKTLAVILHCDDFSADISACRLWFVAGENWANDLDRLFEDNRGLPTATQFIRPILANTEVADKLIAPAQSAFADVTARRAGMIQEIVAKFELRSSAVEKICLVARSRFRLWDDPGAFLRSDSLEEAGFQVTHVDLDRPETASPLALAEAGAACDVMLTVDLPRCDASGVTANELPWITWITKPRIPSADSAGPRDKLLIADPAWRNIAKQAGWDDARVLVAAWPAYATAPRNLALPAYLGILADTIQLDVPASIAGYSSQILLWEFIRDELIDNPFALPDDIERYLDERRARFQISDPGFDPALFAERLIVPAYQQGIARLLVCEGIPVRLFGRGWEAIELFAPRSGGEVGSRFHLDQIMRDAAALVQVWPWRKAHPIDGSGRPVIRCSGKRRETFLQEVRRALSSGHNPSDASSQALTTELLSQVIATL